MRRAVNERTLLRLSLAGGLPALVLALVLLARSPISSPAAWALGALVVVAWVAAALAVRARVAFRLRTASNLLAAAREGDYSFRVRGGRRDDAFGELVLELNLLAATLREQRLDELEATALLDKVMGEIDVAFFAFDRDGRLRAANRAGERLLGRDPLAALGLEASALGLDGFLAGPPARTVELRLPGGAGRWELRRGTYRHGGRPLTLLLLSDVSRALRAEELAAWRRLIRVIGHELNNSLAPIKSIAGSLDKLAARHELPEGFREDLQRGLKVIASRADSLNRFMGAYALLAKMPEPALRPVDLAPLVQRVAGLETRTAVEVTAGPETRIEVDPDQLEQALINLIRNAADAAGAAGRVAVGWLRAADHVDLFVEDDGPGLPDSANMFVPFFTTKPGGSGIGLVLCRQVAEAHGGSLALASRSDGPGCRAVLRLPLRRAEPVAPQPPHAQPSSSSTMPTSAPRLRQRSSTVNTRS